MPLRHAKLAATSLPLAAGRGISIKYSKNADPSRAQLTISKQQMKSYHPEQVWPL
jgi:hypothetical protein